MANARPTFTFVPRRRVIGLSFGTMRSLHRGAGTDIAGSRPYRRSDSMDVIDWAASARLSTARDADEFLVRERFAEEAPKIILVCDRRPSMAHFGAPLPWLDKPAAMRAVVELVLASAGASGGYVGYLDFADGDAHWRQPKGERKLLEIRDQRLESSEFGSPADWLDRSIAYLAERRRATHPNDGGIEKRSGALRAASGRSQEQCASGDERRTTSGRSASGCSPATHTSQTTRSSGGRASVRRR